MQPVGGIEFVKQLRALPNTPVSNTKVIFLSADSSPATVGEALPLGVAGYLVKPPSLSALATKIEAALRECSGGQVTGRALASVLVYPHAIIAGR